MVASAYTLIIVESPAKCKIIKTYLEKLFPHKRFIVEASFGHIRDLPKKDLGVLNYDTSSKLVVRYINNDKKADQISKLSKLASSANCEKVILASDNDREGESISWHLREALKLKKSQYQRMIFNEITESALKFSYQNLKDIDMDLVNAQQTRRIIDRIVGFKISPLLWKTFRIENGANPLSAGRVQSATLRYIIDKEDEIKKHVSEAYWTVKGSFTFAGTWEDECKLYSNNTIKHFEKSKEAVELLGKLSGNWVVLNSRLHNTHESPDAPFITSTLQQEASAKLGFSVKSTMALAQQLYEKGYITYMRTDSFAISKQAISDIKAYVTKEYGEAYWEQRDWSSKKRIKNGQEAHEAIRPTNCNRKLSANTNDQLKKLYDLIHKRAVASQMKSATYSTLDILFHDKQMKNASVTECFKGKLQAIIHPGYLIVYGVQADKNKLDMLKRLADIREKITIDCHEIVAKNTWKSAPTRYNEAGLIKILEKDGIGRPSTYANILEKLYSKSYVVQQNTEGDKYTCVDYVKSFASKSKAKITENTHEVTLNAEMNRLVPTEIGTRINEYMTANFPDIVDKMFTSEMEEKLDTIAEGANNWESAVREFWNLLKPNVEAAEKLTVPHKDREILETAHDEYTINGSQCVVRIGKYGPLIEIKANDPKKKSSFIGLKPYLRLVKKSFSEMNEKEIENLMTLPKNLNAKKDAWLKYGRYGFYITIGKDNYMLPAKWVKSTIGSWENTHLIGDKHLDEIVKLKAAYLQSKKKRRE